MGGNRGGLGAPEAPHSQRAARLSTGLARGSPAHPACAHPAGSRAGSSAAATSARLLRSPTPAGRRSGVGVPAPRGPTDPARGPGGRAPIGGRDLGTGKLRDLGRPSTHHGAIYGTRPAGIAQALVNPD